MKKFFLLLVIMIWAAGCTTTATKGELTELVSFAQQDVVPSERAGDLFSDLRRNEVLIIKNQICQQADLDSAYRRLSLKAAAWEIQAMTRPIAPGPHGSAYTVGKAVKTAIVHGNTFQEIISSSGIKPEELTQVIEKALARSSEPELRDLFLEVAVILAGKQG